MSPVSGCARSGGLGFRGLGFRGPTKLETKQGTDRLLPESRQGQNRLWVRGRLKQRLLLQGRRMITPTALASAATDVTRSIDSTLVVWNSIHD